MEWKSEQLGGKLYYVEKRHGTERKAAQNLRCRRLSRFPGPILCFFFPITKRWQKCKAGHGGCMLRHNGRCGSYPTQELAIIKLEQDKYNNRWTLLGHVDEFFCVYTVICLLSAFSCGIQFTYYTLMWVVYQQSFTVSTGLVLLNSKKYLCSVVKGLDNECLHKLKFRYTERR